MRMIYSALVALLCLPPAVREALAQATAPTSPALPGGDAPHPADTEKVIPEKQAPAPSPTDPSQPSGLPPVRDGVITPPRGIDPGINLPPPRTGSDAMPVIPPPTTDSEGKPVTPK